MRCPDCNVEPGQPHDHGCDIERCQVTGGQWITCPGLGPDPDDPDDVVAWNEMYSASDLHDCGSGIWEPEHAY